jgi:cytochrome bd-type quinol oxidase subunit 2
MKQKKFLTLLALKLGDIETPSGYKIDTDNPLVPLEKIFSNLLAVFTIVGGLMFIIYFIIAAFKWITAGDKAESAEKARTQMTNGLLGLIVLVAAYALFYIIGLVLGMNFLNPSAITNKLSPDYIP